MAVDLKPPVAGLRTHLSVYLLLIILITRCNDISLSQTLVSRFISVFSRDSCMYSIIICKLIWWYADTNIRQSGRGGEIGFHYFCDSARAYSWPLTKWRPSNKEIGSLDRDFLLLICCCLCFSTLKFHIFPPKHCVSNVWPLATCWPHGSSHFETIKISKIVTNKVIRNTFNYTPLKSEYNQRWIINN